MSLFNLSESESKACGLKIARGGRIDDIDVEAIRNEIIDCEYDICRVKLSLRDTELYSKLDQLGFYYSTYSTIVRTRVRGEEKHANPYIPEELVFEEYDGSRVTELTNLITEGLKKNTDVYFYSDLYSMIINPDDFIKSATEYYLSFNNKTDPDKVLYILRYNGKCIGFYCLDISGRDIDEIMALIHPEYRNKGFMQYFLAHGLGVGAKLSKRFGFADIVLQNLPSLNAHINSGYTVYKSYCNIILYPLLSSSKKEIPIQSLNGIDINNPCFPDELIEQLRKTYSLNLLVKKFVVNEIDTCGLHAAEKKLYTTMYHNDKDFFIAGKIKSALHQKATSAFYIKGILS